MQTAKTEPTKKRQRKSYIESNGVRFPKDGVLITGRIRGSLRENDYENREAQAVLRIVKPGDTVLELGAGLGFISTLVAKQIAIKAVHAFEANPTLIPFIKSVYAENKVENAFLHNAVLGPENGTTSFYVRRNFLSSSLSKEFVPNFRSEETIEVRSTKQTMQDIQPDVLICDIEGAEAEIIPDMDLSSVRAAVVELHPQWIGENGVRVVFEAMSNAGLTYFPRLSQGKVVCFKRDY